MTDTPDRIVIAGAAPIDPSRLDEALAAGAAMAAASRAEEGCVDYRFSIDVDDPNLVRLFEEWESQAALDAHFATAHFAEFNELLAQVLAGAPAINRYEVTGVGPLFG